MEVNEAMAIAKRQYPDMIVTGAGDAGGAWIFGFDFPDMDTYPSEPGLPMLAVEKETGRVMDMSPGTKAFDTYMPASKPLDISEVSKAL